MREHEKLSLNLVSKATLHFVLGRLSRKQTVHSEPRRRCICALMGDSSQTFLFHQHFPHNVPGTMRCLWVLCSESFRVYVLFFSSASKFGSSDLFSVYLRESRIEYDSTLRGAKLFSKIQGKILFNSISII